VTRFYLLYVLPTSPTPYKRYIFDFHTASQDFILTDETNLQTAFEFQKISYDTIRTVSEVEQVLLTYPSLYPEPEPNRTLIKVARLNLVKEYEIVIHNQNSLRNFYSHLNRTVMLYDVFMAPESFRIIMFGQYLNNTLSSYKFVRDCVVLLENNASYVKSTIRSIEVYNSSISTEPLKVMIYS